MSTVTDTALGGRLGQSTLRPDGVPKVQGTFEFSSDRFEHAWFPGDEQAGAR